jgi:putative membrane protein
LLFILIGVALGIVAGFIPGFNSNNLCMLLMTYGIISSNYYLAVTVVAIEISFSFFEFLSPMIFGIGSEATALAISSVPASITKESFKRGMTLIVSGGLVGILISLPLLFFAEKIYPVVYSSLKPLVGWILLFLCIYIIWIERNWKKKIFAVAIFCLSGLFGLLVKNSGLVSSEYLLMPIFIGLYGFSSIISKKHEKVDSVQEIQDVNWTRKIRAAVIGFIATAFASMIAGMKRGQTSAIALQAGRIFKREEVLFILPMISLAFVTLSILVLGSTGRIRSNLAYDVQELVAEPYFSETALFVGAIAISACISACILILLAKPMGAFLSRINGKYLKIFGFCICMLLIVKFTGVNGVLIAFTATCIGILSSRLGVRSTHMMGVLLLPSIVAAIL